MPSMFGNEHCEQIGETTSSRETPLGIAMVDVGVPESVSQPNRR